MPGHDSSYWMESAPPGTPRPPLTRDLDADVVVVGAGIAGLCTARGLALAGCRVVVLEAGRIAAGVTGHTTGKLTALHGLCYDRLCREHGAEAAARYAGAQRDALDEVVRICAELGADAWIEHRPAYTYALDRRTAGRVRAEAAAAAAAGLRASAVTETGLPYPVAAAVRVDDQLQFHPRRFLLALAEDLAARGVRIHEDTRVTEVREGPDPGVTTEGGATVRAHDVVLATNFPLRCPPALLLRLSVRRELVVAAVVEERHAPYGMYLTPEGGTRSVRTAPADGGRRLLIVAGESFEPGAGGVRHRFGRLEAWASSRLPGFAEATDVRRWAAQDVHTADGLPCVGPTGSGAGGVHVATGFGGWGLSNGVAAGRLLTARLTDAPLPGWAGLVDPRRHLPLREYPGVARHQAGVARHYAAGFGPRRRRCTHMGCELGFNQAENTWECPCHGSRFAADGTVLQGPATRPLED
ncbi:FAD-dependent oxidoreductase [Streptomyces filamentosus]|uniref:FAD-dependent oxidoreductase n=1 Tax=Streptomyces filamentosus TaxID=67294 RepID=UPI001238C06F|nr:FAD-dependent oxidoreductase [Streptomyces filamentosus]KAA6216041.1 FAD-dependent oxidoreductase [Streptomyces filamentosus]